jgi:hypothetical protein
VDDDEDEDEDPTGAVPSGVIFDALSGESVEAASLAAGGVDAAEVASGFEPGDIPGFDASDFDVADVAPAA